MNNNIPLIVDLDHTLIDTDLLYQSSIGTLRKKPWLLFIYPFWLWRGKGYLKSRLAKRFAIDVSTLAYNQAVIDYIKMRRKNGDPIILATASHKIYAFAVAKYLTIPAGDQKSGVKHPKTIYLFDDVMASNANFNLSSHHKADKLVARFGKKNFDYMGDHRRDLPVWRAANLAILVNATQKIIRKTRHLDTLVLSKKSGKFARLNKN